MVGCKVGVYLGVYVCVCAGVFLACFFNCAGVALELSPYIIPPGGSFALRFVVTAIPCLADGNVRCFSLSDSVMFTSTHALSLLLGRLMFCRF